VSDTSASKSVAVDTGARETETEHISDRINEDADTGVRFEPQPPSSKAVNVSTSCNSDSDIYGKILNLPPIRRTLVISRA
jgi:hypothetical protein